MSSAETNDKPVRSWWKYNNRAMRLIPVNTVTQYVNTVFCVFSSCWSTWSAWCLATSAVWGWRWWRDRLSLQLESPVKWRSSKPLSHFSNTTKPSMRRYDRVSVWNEVNEEEGAHANMWERRKHLWKLKVSFLFFQVRERLRVALERCSALEEQLTMSHKEVSKQNFSLDTKTSINYPPSSMWSKLHRLK